MVSSCMGAIAMIDKGKEADKDTGNDGHAKPDHRRRVSRKCRQRRERIGIEDPKQSSLGRASGYGGPELNLVNAKNMHILMQGGITFIDNHSRNCKVLVFYKVQRDSDPYGTNLTPS